MQEKYLKLFIASKKPLGNGCKNLNCKESLLNLRGLKENGGVFDFFYKNYSN
jgi:hypothetical protein